MKKLLSLKISFLFFLVIFSCNKKDLSSISCQENTNSYNLTEAGIDPKIENITIETEEVRQKVLVFFVHGFTSDENLDKTVEGFKEYEEGLKEILPSKNIIYHRLKYSGSRTMKFIKQGEMVSKMISKYIKDNNYDKNIPIVLIGHSAGSLTSYTIYKKFSKELNILGIVSVSGIWKGIYILDKSKNTKHKVLVNLFTKSIDTTQDGIQDIIPNSDFLCWVNDSLQECDIPIYTIGCRTKVFSNLFSLKPLTVVFKLDKNAEKEIFGSEYHDGMIPLESQLGTKMKNLESVELQKCMLHGVTIKRHIDKLVGMLNHFEFMYSSETEGKMKNIIEEPAMRKDKVTFAATACCIKKILLKNNISIQ